eukprot:TRINITY_DN14087_c0_g1_i1.p1 TRINITY_DN14087_c0_g1~~TRINITY_DN14087_c0_g1_i1.p1  ORF type:complete len:109 (-),score=4.54 TRINITY_DN14087_c0_g1_i1:337-663(-)
MYRAESIVWSGSWLSHDAITKYYREGSGAELMLVSGVLLFHLMIRDPVSGIALRHKTSEALFRTINLEGQKKKKKKKKKVLCVDTTASYLEIGSPCPEPLMMGMNVLV